MVKRGPTPSSFLINCLYLQRQIESVIYFFGGMFRIISIVPTGHHGKITCCLMAAAAMSMVSGIAYGQQLWMFVFVLAMVLIQVRQTCYNIVFRRSYSSDQLNQGLSKHQEIGFTLVTEVLQSNEGT